MLRNLIVLAIISLFSLGLPILGACNENISTELPSHLSGFEGWNGFHIAYKERKGTQGICVLEIPSSFGEERIEFRILEKLLTSDPVHDLKCARFTMKEVILPHVFQLAVDGKDIRAARYLLDMRLPERLNLDGYLYEEFVGYLLPVIEALAERIDVVGVRGDPAMLGKHICFQGKVDDELKRAYTAADTFEAAEMTEVATAIRDACEKIAAE